jgi:hypothetical protein
MAAASSARSILTLPPSAALAFLLSTRALPQVTSRTLRSPALTDRVLAICAGSIDHAAESVMVALLISSSMIGTSGAFAARNARTDSRLMVGTPATFRLRRAAATRPHQIGGSAS